MIDRLPKWRDDDMRLSDLVRDYIADPRYLKTARSKETYDHCLRQFLGYLQVRGIDNSVSSFTADNVEGFLPTLYERGMKNVSINLRLSALSGLAIYAMQNKKNGKRVMESNPIECVKRPQNEEPDRGYLAPDEIHALLGVEGHANERLAIAFLFFTRLRATAAAEAKVKNLQLDGDRVVLRAIEKGLHHETLVLAPEVAEPLLASLKLREAGPEEPLLVNTEGNAYTRQSLSEMVARLAFRAGITRITVRAHMLARHTPATIAGQNGANEFEIAALLRHRGTSTAKRYVHGVKADAAFARVRQALGLS